MGLAGLYTGLGYGVVYTIVHMRTEWRARKVRQYAVEPAPKKPRG